MPAWVPESTLTLSILLLVCSMVQSAVRIYPMALMPHADCLDEWIRWLDAERGQHVACLH